MNGINNFLNYITETFRFSFGKDWDASGEMRSGIKRDLAMISSGNINWQNLILSSRQSAWPSIELDVKAGPTNRNRTESLPTTWEVQMSRYGPNSRLSS
jgi:hypothetical protein